MLCWNSWNQAQQGRTWNRHLPVPRLYCGALVASTGGRGTGVGVNCGIGVRLGARVARLRGVGVGRFGRTGFLVGLGCGASSGVMGAAGAGSTGPMGAGAEGGGAAGSTGCTTGVRFGRGILVGRTFFGVGGTLAGWVAGAGASIEWGRAGGGSGACGVPVGAGGRSGAGVATGIWSGVEMRFGFGVLRGATITTCSALRTGWRVNMTLISCVASLTE